MMLEESRRGQDDDLASTIARKGRAALVDMPQTDETREIQSIVIPEAGGSFLDDSNDLSTKLAGTTGLSARMECTDFSEQHVWLQTAVVDLLGDGTAQRCFSAFVLEVRERRSSGSRLRAQLDVHFIES